MGQKKRQSKFKPDPTKRVVFQKRDAEIIYEIFKDQFLTAKQINSLFFNSLNACQVRLRKLYDAGCLRRTYAPVSFGTSEAIYSPTKKGIDFVKKTLNLNELNFKSATYRVSPTKQRHEIEVNQLKVSLIQALRKRPEIELLFCLKGPKTWDYVKDPNPKSQEKREFIPIRPDRFFGLKVKDNCQYFFLELDRGTMRLSEFQRKLRGYKAYYFSGGFLKKYGKKDQEIKDLPFRVLIVAPTEKRRNNLIEQALLIGSNLMMWFTTFDKAEKDFLGKIWLRGRDYKEVFKDFSQKEQERIRTTHRWEERDKIVREKTNFLSLL
jgi:hypothetical protein